MCEQNSEQLIFCAIEEYNKKMLDALPSVEELDGITLSRKFERRMQKLIRQRSHFYYPLINTSFKRVACFVLISIAVLSTITAQSKSVRKFFTNFFVDRVTEYSSRIFLSTDISNAPKEIVINLPKYIPEDFVIEDSYQADNHSKHIYKNLTKEYFFEVTQYLLDSESFSHAGPQELIEEINIDGIKAIYIDYTEYRTLIFVSNGYKYKLKTNLSKKEFIKIAKSLI